MPTSQNFTAYTNNVNSYLPAVLKENKSGWIIEYYAAHPQTEALVRKKIKLNRIVSRYKKTSDARKHIASMIVKINNQLMTIIVYESKTESILYLFKFFLCNV